MAYFLCVNGNSNQNKTSLVCPQTSKKTNQKQQQELRLFANSCSTTVKRIRELAVVLSFWDGRLKIFREPCQSSKAALYWCDGGCSTSTETSSKQVFVLASKTCEIQFFYFAAKCSKI
jgi:hypothetical protein